MAGYKMGAGKAPGKKAYDGFSGFQQRGLISPLQQEKKTVLSHPGEKPILGRFTEGSTEDKYGDFQFSGDTKGIVSKSTGMSFTPGDSAYNQAHKKMVEQYSMRAGDYDTRLAAYQKQEEAKQIAGGKKPTE